MFSFSPKLARLDFETALGNRITYVDNALFIPQIGSTVLLGSEEYTVTDIIYDYDIKRGSSKMVPESEVASSWKVVVKKK